MTKNAAIGMVCVFVLVAGLSGCANLGGFGGASSTGPGLSSSSAVSGSEDDFEATVGRTILFSESSFALSAEEETHLDKQAEWLKNNPTWLVKVQGHADDPGSESENKTLSQRRAEIVLAGLVSRGVEARRMWAKGYGIERPLTDCDPAACSRLDRRVVLNLRESYDDSAPKALRN